MHPRPSLALLAATILLVIPAFVVTAAAADNGQRDEHARIVAFWTPERMQSAIPRDFTIEPGRAAVPAGKPGTGGGGSGTTVGGASWTNTNTKIYKASGKVYFVMGSFAYICSGSVVTDGRAGYSLVLTAGHCAFDESTGLFATQWMFIPQFDSNPTYTCENTAFGCWTSTALVVHTGYATAGSYNTQATLHDYAIAAVGPGGKSGSAQLDVTVGSFPITFTAVNDGTQTYAFGYPAAGKYRGADLVYCAGPVGSDPLNGNRTYRLGCDMTGGSSGGPWLTGFNASTGDGTLTSVNSYTYSSVKNKMHGPKFDGKTQAVFNAADATTSNTIVGG